MKKEALTFKNVKRDLDRMAFSRMSSAEDHRLGYITSRIYTPVNSSHSTTACERRRVKQNKKEKRHQGAHAQSAGSQIGKG
jgi:hypothetical protein